MVSRWNNFKYTTIYGRTFSNESVPLDGMYFVNCSFQNVTFEYNGSGPFQIAGTVTMGGTLRVHSPDPRVGTGLNLARIIAKTVGSPPEPTSRDLAPWQKSN